MSKMWRSRLTAHLNPFESDNLQANVYFDRVELGIDALKVRDLATNRVLFLSAPTRWDG